MVCSCSTSHVSSPAFDSGALYIYVLFFVNLVGYALGITGTLGLLHLAFGDAPSTAPRRSLGKEGRSFWAHGVSQALPLLMCTGLLALSMVQAPLSRRKSRNREPQASRGSPSLLLSHPTFPCR